MLIHPCNSTYYLVGMYLRLIFPKNEICKNTPYKVI